MLQLLQFFAIVAVYGLVHFLKVYFVVADGATANCLTELLMDLLVTKWSMNSDAIACKLHCFEADGVSAFQGKRTGVTLQIKKNFAPFATGVHCHAHKINLAVKTCYSCLQFMQWRS